MNNIRMRRNGLCLLMLAATFGAGQASAEIAFAEVTAAAGFAYRGETWGASWADFSGDGRPDLFVSNHRSMDALYRNEGNGSFKDVRDAYGLTPFWSFTWPDGDHADHHGATWTDFDNDGDQDLMIASGGVTETQLLMNRGTSFSNVTTAYGFGTTLRGSRLPVWFDYNDDGQLDVLLFNSHAAAQLYRQGTGSFVATGTQLQNCSSGHYAQLSDVKNDGAMKLICENSSNQFPDRIYDFSTLPFTDITSAIPRIANVNDTVVADFNGDLRPDVFAVNGMQRISGAAQTGSNRLDASMVGAVYKILTFNTTGVITVQMFWDLLDIDTATYKNRIWIGSNSLHPSNIASLIDTSGIGTLEFTLDPANPDYHGIRPYNPAVDTGIYIGYDPVKNTWTVVTCSGPNWSVATFLISSTAAVSNVNMSGNIYGAELPINPTLMLNSATGFVNALTGSGLDVKVSCISTAAGDFDNDMDLDIYLVCRSGTGNISNRLFRNNGNATFVEVPSAGGAGGIIGDQVVDGAGSGENVVLADYDVDGFLDLFVTNGLNMIPYRQGGPDQLFHNLGNSNRWIELDLRGTTSNRDGIGAKVLATAGGVTQLREQNGGYHRWAQNDKRLHFGLATSTTVSLRIEWPSGIVDTFSNVPANHLYRITEGGGYQEIVPTPPGGSNVVPVITGQVPLSTAANTPLAITLASLTVTDPDNAYPADFTLNVQTGANYTVSGTTITPATGFTGTLTVPVTVNDGSANSAVFSLTVSVTGGTPSPCNTPPQSPGTEAAVFVWKNCTTGIWSMRVTAGGGSKTYNGSVDSSQPFSTVTPVSMEANDTLNYTTDPSRIVFGLTTTSTYQDGFDFSFPASADVCFNVNLPAGATVYVGGARTVVGTSFSLATLGACSTSSNVAPVITGQVPLSTPQNTALTLVLGNLTVTDPDNAYPADFTLNVQTGTNYTVSGTTITPATGFTGTLTVPVTVNDGSVNSAVFNLTVSVAGSAPSPCSTPAQSPGTEAAVFVWKNCTTGIWSMRVTAGGGSKSYSGSVDSSQPFSTVTPVSVEANDTLNYTTDPSRIVFGLTTTSTYQDGFDFSFPVSADVCFNVNLPAGTTVYVGGARTVVGPSFSLATLGACN